MGREDRVRRALSPPRLWSLPSSTPPLALLVGSIDTAFATLAKLLPDSISFLAALAAASVLVRMIWTVRFSGVPYLRLVFVVVLFDLRFGDCAFPFAIFFWIFVRQQVQLHAQQQIRHRLARRREEFFEFRGLRELLGLDFFEFLLDFLVAQFTPSAWLRRAPTRGDQESEDLLCSDLYCVAHSDFSGAVVGRSGLWPVSAWSHPGGRCRPCSRAVPERPAFALAPVALEAAATPIQWFERLFRDRGAATCTTALPGMPAARGQPDEGKQNGAKRRDETEGL